MKEKGGIGLAANQAGLDLKLVVIDIPPFKTNKNIVFKLINPKILKKEGRRKFEEGCLSFPNLSLTIKRAERVWVEALDERGKILNLEAKGILSIVLQHEIDHINGIVFIDRLSFWERVKILPKLRKLKLN
ncbi:MAG: peptide deformylase [Candidatus Omnitrophica bacterium 4484_70.2]|nr:MAG: peptide deformylase [Candidatus Omnitrophica bacterium 4484_70.2]